MNEDIRNANVDYIMKMLLVVIFPIRKIMFLMAFFFLNLEFFSFCEFLGYYQLVQSSDFLKGWHMIIDCDFDKKI